MPAGAATLHRLLWAEEVASQIGIPLQTVYRLTRDGHLPVVRVGRLYRYQPDAILAWMEAGGTVANGS